MLERSEIAQILCHWFGETDFTASKTTKGTSSNSYKITTSDGTFILRQLPSIFAATQEYEISQLLHGTGISAEILPTQHKEPFVYAQFPYNLQTFLPGCAPNLTEKATITAAAHTLATMQQCFSKSELVLSDTDRFETMSLWTQVTSQYALLTDFFSPDCAAEEMQVQIQKIEAALLRDQIIHGDLGSWNMLWDGNSIFFIDFAECRLGDYYMDIAAVVASLLRAAPDNKTLFESMDLFINTYEDCYQPIDLIKLQDVLWLWLLRGAMAVCIYVSKPEQKKAYIQHFYSDFAKYQHWMGLYSKKDLIL